MSDNKWEGWEMSAVNSKYIHYLTQLLVAKGVVSKSDLEQLCKQLVENLERTASAGAADYAKVIAKDILA